MNSVVQRLLMSRLRGTWIHHAVWAYKNPPPKAESRTDGKQVALNDRNANYDRQTVEVMFQVLHRNSNCVDVGAHCGDILQHMINISPRGRHFAFEPLPHFSQNLSKRFPRAIVHQAAVSDRSGESEFQFVENDPGYSGLRRRIYDRPDPKITTIRVRMVTLDEIIPPNEKIAFIKIDIEGGEFHAIKGGIETIRRGRPVIVFEAGSRSTGQYGVKPDDLYLFVTETLGYELSTMQRWLKRKAAYAREEFDKNWNQGSEYYFIAAPKKGTS
jgi:FkbM family methyltransferase